MKEDAVRLDVLLAERGLISSRSRAQRAIRAGSVEVDGQITRKPSARVSRRASVRVRVPLPYVSRGGEKLACALDHFRLDVSGRRALDGGASTGGFTDCLLQRGARSVCALDVGRDQLAPRLRADPRVNSLEGANLRQLRPQDVPGAPFDLATLDVSFISLTLILSPVRHLLRPGSPAIILVKPQFEVGPSRVGKGGVVRDRRAHRDALNSVLAAAREAGFSVCDLVPSPLTGSGGNVEFFAFLWLPPLPPARGTISAARQEGYVDDCVEQAHRV